MDLNDLAYRAIASAFGAPVDLTAMVLRPLGYKTPEQNVVGGSEWIGQKMQDLGLVSSARNPNAEMLASMLVPGPSELMGAAKGGVALLGMVKPGDVGDALGRMMNAAGKDGLIPIKNVFEKQMVDPPMVSFIKGSKPQDVTVDVAKIAPTQSEVHSEGLLEKVMDQAQGASMRDATTKAFPEAIKRGDEYILLDGHHRVAAAIAQGQKNVPLHVIGEVPAKKVKAPMLKESDYYYHGTPISNAASIERTGLSPGLSGMTGLTQEGPKAAQDWAKAMQRGQVKGEKDIALIRVRKDTVQPDLVDRGEVFVRNGVPPELIEISLDGGKTWSKAMK